MKRFIVTFMVVFVLTVGSLFVIQNMTPVEVDIKPKQQQVSKKNEPLVRKAESVVTSLREIDEWATAEMDTETRVTLDRDGGLFNACYQSMELVATHRVKAGFDGGKIVVSAENDGNLDSAKITITIPRPKILSVELMGTVHTLDQASDWIPGCTRDGDKWIAGAIGSSEDLAVVKAQTDGIFEMAIDNLKRQLISRITVLGYQENQITFKE